MARKGSASRGLHPVGGGPRLVDGDVLLLDAGRIGGDLARQGELRMTGQVARAGDGGAEGERPAARGGVRLQAAVRVHRGRPVDAGADQAGPQAQPGLPRIADRTNRRGAEAPDVGQHTAGRARCWVGRRGDAVVGGPVVGVDLVAFAHRAEHRRGGVGDHAGRGPAAAQGVVHQVVGVVEVGAVPAVGARQLVVVVAALVHLQVGEQHVVGGLPGGLRVPAVERAVGAQLPDRRGRRVGVAVEFGVGAAFGAGVRVAAAQAARQARAAALRGQAGVEFAGVVHGAAEAAVDQGVAAGAAPAQVDLAAQTGLQACPVARQLRRLDVQQVDLARARVHAVGAGRDEALAVDGHRDVLALEAVGVEIGDAGRAAADCRERRTLQQSLEAVAVGDGQHRLAGAHAVDDDEHRVGQGVPDVVSCVHRGGEGRAGRRHHRQQDHGQQQDVPAARAAAAVDHHGDLPMGRGYQTGPRDAGRERRREILAGERARRHRARS
ncbi:MAG: hypothetical protein IPH09_16565 [bacterium]|nr:hypothetical protein [bacterium]